MQQGSTWQLDHERRGRDQVAAGARRWPARPGGDGAVVHLTSSFDRSASPFAVTVLLLFDRPIPDPAKTVRAALSAALAHYRPVAGRFAADADGGPLRIEGAASVPFVAASASFALADVTAAPMLLGRLAARFPGELCRPADPLLLVQVTEFACGGFAVAATLNQVLMDGKGIAQFLGAVGELARGASPAPSVVPLRADDGLLSRLPQSMVAAQKEALSFVFHKDFALLDVTVPSGLIRRVRAEFDAAGLDSWEQQPCTAFEDVAAVLWQCRTRAVVVSVSNEAPVTLSFVANVRRLVGARPGYYGNCAVVQSVTSTRGQVANGAAADVARMIRRAKERIPDLLLPIEVCTTTEQGAMALPYNTLAVSCWRNLGFEAVDFGGGRPARVTWHVEETVVPGCVVSPPRNDGDKGGVSVMTLCVRPEQADAFLAEHAAMSLASMPSSKL